MVMKNWDRCSTYRCGRRRYWLDRSRQRLVRLTGEEKVRYNAVETLMQEYGYPSSWIHTEISLQDGSGQRADILVRPAKAQCAVMVVECKKQGVPLTVAHEEQALGYCMATGARYMALTNGREVLAWMVDHHGQSRTPVDELPHFGQLSMEQLQCGSELSADRPHGSDSESAYSLLPGTFSDPDATELAGRLNRLIASSAAMFTEPFEWRGHTFVEDMGMGTRPLGRIRGCWWDGGYRSVLALSPEGDAYVVRFKVGRSDRDHVNYLYVVVSVGTRNRCRLALCLDDYGQADVVRELTETGSGPQSLANLAVEAMGKHVRRS
jgi:hypothetical protein